MRLGFPSQSHGQSLKEERGFSAVLSDIGDASPDLLRQFYGLMMMIIIILVVFAEQKEAAQSVGARSIVVSGSGTESAQRRSMEEA